MNRKRLRHLRLFSLWRHFWHCREKPH